MTMLVKSYDKITENQYIIRDWPMFEGAGTVLHDLSKNHAHARFEVPGWDPSWAATAAGQPVVFFDGNDMLEAITFPLIPALNLDDFTIEVWVKRDGGWTAFVLNAPGITGTYLRIDPGLEFSDWDLALGVSAGGAGTNLTWYHTVVTRKDITNWAFYVNGVSHEVIEMAPGSFSMAMPAFSYLGVWTFIPFYSTGWNGRLRVYHNYALPPAIVQAHYQAERSLYP